jgi:heme A synthase
MKKLAVLSTAALIGLGSVVSTGAEAGDRRNAGAAVAAGIVGLAAGAMLGAAASNASAASAYAPGPYRTTRVVRGYEYDPEIYEEVYVAPPGYRRSRVVHTYETYAPRYYSANPSVSVEFGFGPRAYGW